MVCDTHGGILQGFWNLYGVQNRRSLKTNKYVAFYESEGGYGYCWMTVRCMNSLTIIVT